MPRSRPDPGKRRPGRRPPDRYQSLKRPARPGPRGFTEPGLRQVFDAVLPMRGEDRKQFFNQASTGLVVGLGIGGAMVGAWIGGPLGAVLGLGIAVATSGRFVEGRRFYRR